MNTRIADRAGVTKFGDSDQFLITAILHEIIDLVRETTKGYSDFPLGNIIDGRWNTLAFARY